MARQSGFYWGSTFHDAKLSLSLPLPLRERPPVSTTVDHLKASAISMAQQTRGDDTAELEVTSHGPRLSGYSLSP